MKTRNLDCPDFGTGKETEECRKCPRDVYFECCILYAKRLYERLANEGTWGGVFENE